MSTDRSAAAAAAEKSYDQPLTIVDLEEYASKTMGSLEYEYYSEGSGRRTTRDDNRLAFDRHAFV